MTLAFIPDPKFIVQAQGRHRLDRVSALLSSGLASLQYVLERGQRDDWFNSSTISTLSIVAAVIAHALHLRELRDAQPLVDLTRIQAPLVLAPAASSASSWASDSSARR